jgi:hypothetical protein
LSPEKRWQSHRTPKKAKAPASEGGRYKGQHSRDRLGEVVKRIAERAIDREGREL